MDNLPAVLIVSCSNTKPKSLIKLITKQANICGDNSIIQPWSINTKYYSAQINVIGIDETFQRNEEFNNNIEAIILHMDSNKSSGLEDLSKWDCLQEECNAEVKLLLANYCNEDTKVTQARAVEWCLKKGFEFIELYPTKPASPEQDLIEEKFGVERVVEALETHSWSNLIPKQPKNHKPKEPNNKGDEFLTEEGLDDFTELFSHLHMMKDNFQAMPMGQRKQCAEQMVSAFWQAIGGEEEELLDL